ncbi:hypothetical protein ACH5RR_017514 [Cinchona calisaya]|uniref:MULE transposase domain-containing protein n=1 Tax=Cinchona calisaya TaxID=153742 RepID=A0ABD2ZIS7_9GENT
MKLADKCSDEKDVQQFQRLYMYFFGVKEPFLVACRPFFGLDGTFLKGDARGVLLTAVGVDPNNGFFPIAYAATEEETKDSWMWFLNLLKEDLKIEKDYEWTIMNDKQKASFKGTSLRHALCVVAKAATAAQFVLKMKELVEIDEDTAKWLDDKPASELSRSHFRTFPKCDMLLNNICESFNSKIVDARGESIIKMMEKIRLYVMTRMKDNRDKAKQRWVRHKFTPKIMKRLKNNMGKSHSIVIYQVFLAGEQDWEDIDATYPLPPSYKSATGRPKKNIRKGEDEIQQIKGKTKKMRRTGHFNACTFCHNRGHNIRSCNLRKEAQNAASDGQEPVQQGYSKIFFIDLVFYFIL